MKNKKKKRGFTLVELLATITILSVVMIIAIPSVTKLIKKFGNNYYEILEGNVKLAGIDYFTDHKTEIPKYVNESSVIDLKTLAEKGYLEEYPKNKNEEDITEGYVLAYKTGKGKYEYQACINTQNNDYKTDKEYCKDKYTLLYNEILVPPSNGVYALPQKKPGNFDDIIRIYDATKQHKTSNSIREIIDITETAAPIKAIVSCENDCKDIDVFKAGNTSYEEKDLTNLKNIISGYFENAKDPYPSALKNFLNKKIKIKYIYQDNGKTAEALFSFVEANEGEAPGEIEVVLNKETETENGGQVYGYEEDGVWKIIDIPDNTDSINWYNKKIVATVSPINENEKRIKKYYCKSESNFFECSDELVSKIPYTDTNSIIKIYGVNKYGTATNTVTYSVKTDTTPPTCQSTGGSSSWTNSNVTVFGRCTDSATGSGCVNATTTPQTFTSNYNGSVSPGTVYDNAGNSATCPNETVRIDKTPPTCSSTGGSSSWTNSNVTVTGTCSDSGGSGCVKSTVTETKTSNFNGYVSPGTVYDNAGNSAYCSSQIVKIDKTPPTCTSSGGSSSWTRNNVTVTGTCSDSGGSGCVKSTVTETITSDYNGSVSPGTVYDNAGNSATCSNKTVKVDKTPPQIEDDNSKGYNAGSCTSFKSHDSNTVIHRFKMVSHDYSSGIASIYYKYKYGDDPGSSDSGWVENTNALNLARSNSYLIDYSYTRIRQDYNLLGSGTAYFRFKLCDNAGNCTGVSDKYTASEVTANENNKGKYCRDVFKSSHSGRFIVSD